MIEKNHNPFETPTIVAVEDFDIESLATYLHLTPDQVRKMADRGRLPGRRVGGSWRFSQAEIHHWFEQRIGASDENELIAVEKVLEQQQTHPTHESIELGQLLTVERIAVPLAARTKNSVIDRICELSAASGALWLPKEMADALRRREELHPTALENGVALLHPRRPQTNYFGEPFLALGVSGSGLPFGGPRGSLTDVFFLIASPNEAFHLRILARLSRLIYVDGYLERLRQCDGPLAAWQATMDADQSI